MKLLQTVDNYVIYVQSLKVSDWCLGDPWNRRFFVEIKNACRSQFVSYTYQRSIFLKMSTGAVKGICFTGELNERHQCCHQEGRSENYQLVGHFFPPLLSFSWWEGKWLSFLSQPSQSCINWLTYSSTSFIFKLWNLTSGFISLAAQFSCFPLYSKTTYLLGN